MSEMEGSTGKVGFKKREVRETVTLECMWVSKLVVETLLLRFWTSRRKRKCELRFQVDGRYTERDLRGERGV